MDACEARLVLSAVAPANTLADVAGTVDAPNTVANVTVPVTTRNLNHRHSIILATSVAPSSGSSLIPRLANARGASGESLPLRQGVPAVPGRHPASQAYIRTGQAGELINQVTGRRGSVGGFQLRATLPGDLDGDGQVTGADQKRFQSAYRSTSRNANYLPSADANQNGQIGHGDAKFLLRNLKPLTPKVPLSLFLTLAPEDAAKGPTSQNSGGSTHHKIVTVLGRTTPGSFVFRDNGLGDYSFDGDVIAADDQGNFSVKVINQEGLTTVNFLVIDPYGQQLTRAYPILWINYAATGSKLK